MGRSGVLSPAQPMSSSSPASSSIAADAQTRCRRSAGTATVWNDSHGRFLDARRSPRQAGRRSGSIRDASALPPAHSLA